MSMNLLGFFVAALILLLLPGPGVMYVVARSVGQGCRAGLVSAAGLSAGALVHVAAAAAGLSAIVLASATAFGFVKLAGAGYLIYLGIKALCSDTPTKIDGASTPHPSSRLFTDGVIVSVFNPKIAVFFLAFLPQFVDPNGAPVPQQILLLGFMYSALALVTDSMYALLAGSARNWIGGRALQGPLPRYVSGSLFLGLGAGAALTGRQD